MGKMHFALFLQHSPNANNPIAWKHPRTRVGYEWNHPEIFQEMASIAERALFDLVFVADTLAVNYTYGGSMDSSLRNSVLAPIHDSFTLISLLAGSTKQIGLAPTMSSTYFPPYLLARMMATLDHLSKGRSGWNVVTSFNIAEAKNFGMDQLYSHDERYDIADEYMELCYKLWDAWEPGAVVEDQANGVFVNPSKVHHIHFEGKYFKSQGPLNVARTPQGRPVIIQAGSSDRGIEFAARHAEIVFVLKNSVSEMKKYYDDLKGRMAKYGRKPDDCKVLFGVQPIVGETEEIADIKQKLILNLVSEEAGLTMLSSLMGVDMSVYDFDQPLPDSAKVSGIQGKLKQFYAGDQKPTLREIGRRNAAGLTIPMIGSGEQVAERMEEVMKEVGGDGYMIIPAFWPSALTEFTEMVIPILQRKGLHRTEYAGKTLRDHLFD